MTDWIGSKEVFGLKKNFTGLLCRLSSESDIDQLTKQNLAQLETELMSIREVRRVYIDLDNWRKDKERQWVPVKPLRIGSGEEEE